jgi:hypothetical protein
MSEIPAAAVEAAAMTLFDPDATKDSWDRLPSAVKQSWVQEAQRALAAAAPLIRQDERRATADEIAAEIKDEMETYFAGVFDPALDEAADRIVEIARRVGGGGGGGYE